MSHIFTVRSEKPQEVNQNQEEVLNVWTGKFITKKDSSSDRLRSDGLLINERNQSWKNLCYYQLFIVGSYEPLVSILLTISCLLVWNIQII